MNDSKAKYTEAQKTGYMGETAALKFLERGGFELLAKNYRSYYGEIDIIVRNEEYIVFVEVKTRSQFSVSRPSDWVDPRKQKKIIMTASIFLNENKFDLQPRFDVVEVIYDKYTKEIKHLNHIENAFIQTGDYSVF